MKTILSRICLLAVVLTLGVQHAAAGDIVYSLGEPAYAFGTGGKKAETYDLALRIANTSLVGAQVKGVRIAFASTEGVSEAKAWLSKDLPAIKSSKAQEPDITSKAFEASTDYTEVLFDEPYTITADGIYVGYSFAVPKADEALHPVLLTTTATTDGFYIHSSSVYRTAWRNGLGNDLAIEVLLSSDQFKANAATVGNIPELNVKTGEPTMGTFEVENHGTEGVKSVDYRLTVDGQTLERHEDFGNPLPAIYGRKALVETVIPAIGSKGAYSLNITITKVNGVDNEDASPAGNGTVNAYNTLPRHRAVVEEYTGTWCGYCPRGFMGLELMNQLYPEDFVAISYHNGDPMEVTKMFPSNVPGFPDAWLDRVRETDAYCGDSDYGTFGIDKVWLERCGVFAPASVELATEWTDENTLRGKAYVTFPIENDECPYRVAFSLAADGLSGTTSNWDQSNYYGGATGWPADMDLFTKGESYVKGLTFNDVLIAFSPFAGIEGSLTAPIEADVTQEVTYDFDISQIKAEIVPSDRSKLRIVALLIDSRTGEIVNANKAQAGSTTAIHVTPNAGEVVQSIRYYDLQGRPTSTPERGIYLKSETLQNGKVRTQKIRF